MKTIKLTIILVCTSLATFAQVGIGNTDPKASLDITASNTATPSNTDGILIPKIDNFPATNPGTDQNGMLVFVTGNGTPTKGFYYWDNGATNWVSVTGVKDINDLADGKSDNDGTNNGSSVFLGLDAGLNDDSSNNANVGIGFNALSNNSTGSNNTANGYLALFSNTTGYNNTVIGSAALSSNTTGYDNTVNGYISLSNNTTGYGNTVNGSQALNSNTIGNYNIATGNLTLNRNTTGNYNIAIGNRSLYSNVTGSNNIAIGERAGYSETGSDKLYIENSNANSNNALIYGEFDNDILRTNSEFQIGNPTLTGYSFPTTDGTASQVLTTDGAGNLAFQNVVGDGNTQNNLDQAYDEGGPGVGKNIDASDGAVRINGEDGFLVTGTFGSGNIIDTEITGTGTRMFFNPRKAAFRAGYAEDARWDDANIGEYSFAVSRRSMASGFGSVSLGYDSEAQGDFSFVMGNNSGASDSYSFIMGLNSYDYNNATFSFAFGNSAETRAAYSLAFGQTVDTYGDHSMAKGNNVTAKSYGETVFGFYNTDYTANSTTAFDASDRLFVLGNGLDFSNRSNALTVYKDGRLNINEAYTLPTIDGTANQILTTDGAGNISFQNPIIGVQRINDLIDGKSDNDGSDDGSSLFLGINAGANDDSTHNFNVGIGFEALQSNISSWGNTAIGYRAMQANTIGMNSTATGASSLTNNLSGTNNSAFGNGTLTANTSGSFNSAIGQGSLNSNIDGSYNIALGYWSLLSNTSGSRNVALGSSSGYTNSAGSNNVFIGYQSAYFETGSEKLYIENSNADSNNALIYGEFDNDILRTNGQFQIGNPTITGYSFPVSDGTNNQVMITDGSGNLSFQDIVGDGDTQNTLDEAYDEGGVGNGRLIIADNGAVEIGGEDGFQITGTYGSGDLILLSGGGTRLFFNPRKSAFRAGTISNAEWDNTNIGNYSTAFGSSNIASGEGSTAIGFSNTASGVLAFATGEETTASGATAVTFGVNTTASGNYSMASGYLTEATSSYATAFGNRTEASGNQAVAFGFLTEASGSNSAVFGENSLASGDRSVAFGNNNTASGGASAAFGVNNASIGVGSFTVGSSNTASSDYSIALGEENNATNSNTLAHGYKSTASGNTSVAMGLQNNAPSWGEMTVGTFASIYTASSALGWNTNDRIFTVGNGAGTTTRSNALTIFKNGLINLNDEYNMPLTDGTNGQVMTTDGAGNVTFQNASINTDNQQIDTFNFNTSTNILTLEVEDDGQVAQTVDLSSLQDGNTQNTLDQAYDEGGSGTGRTITADNGAVTINGDDGFLITGTIGSGDTIDSEITGAGTRMFFNPNKAAFRAGYANSSEWDDTNIGEYSTAFGRATTASGEYSTASGSLSTASGNNSTAFGANTTASGDNSTAMGFISEASGNFSTAFGATGIASGDYSTAMGAFVIASGDYSTAIGVFTIAPSYAETSIGSYNNEYTPNSSSAVSLADKLFSIGNGTSSLFRSNALTIYKSGLMNINDAYNMPLTDGTNGQVMTTDGAGNVTFQNATVNTDDQQIDNFNFNSSTNELTLEIEDDGQVAQTVDLSSLNPTKAMAHITLSTDQNNTGGGITKVLFDAEGFDIGNDFDVGTNEFTVPADGIYRVNAQIAINSSTSTGSFDIRIRVDGTQVRITSFNHSGNGNIIRQISSLIELTAGQTIDIAYQRSTAVTINSNSSISYFDIEQL